MVLDTTTAALLLYFYRGFQGPTALPCQILRLVPLNFDVRGRNKDDDKVYPHWQFVLIEILNILPHGSNNMSKINAHEQNEVYSWHISS